MAASSRKGGAFERLCGRELSRWLTGGADETQLIRSVSSGGWSRRRDRQTGDLAPNGPVGEEFRSVFGVECKRREEFRWQHLWTSEVPGLFAWWTKHLGECSEHGLVPILMYKRNYQPLLIGLPADLTSWPWRPSIVVRWEDHEIELVEWDVFTELADPETFYDLGRAWARRNG